MYLPFFYDWFHNTRADWAEIKLHCFIKTIQRKQLAFVCSFFFKFSRVKTLTLLLFFCLHSLSLCVSPLLFSDIDEKSHWKVKWHCATTLSAFFLFNSVHYYGYCLPYEWRTQNNAMEHFKWKNAMKKPLVICLMLIIHKQTSALFHASFSLHLFVVLFGVRFFS